MVSNSSRFEMVSWNGFLTPLGNYEEITTIPVTTLIKTTIVALTIIAVFSLTLSFTSAVRFFHLLQLFLLRVPTSRALLCQPWVSWCHLFWSFHLWALLHFFPIFLFSSIHKATFHCFPLTARAPFWVSCYITLNSTFTFPHMLSKIHNLFVLIPEMKSTIFPLPFKLQVVSLHSFNSCYHLICSIWPSSTLHSFYPLLSSRANHEYLHNQSSFLIGYHSPIS